MISIGTVINGKYRLTRLLGDGGMGSVYEAQHTALGTRVAIKVLHPELTRRTGLVERFLQEARVAAQIRSPNVVQVTDIDRTPEGNAYIVMELLEGEPLSGVLDRQRKLPIPTACEYAVQILTALEAAHALGVIHRDLKPENVFVTFSGGRPILKLIDFGIAKARRDEPGQKNLTVAGVVMGTAEYMAPEQARSAAQVDARADLYAAGVMLYEMIAGARPVNGDDARLIAMRVEQGDVVPLVKVAPDVPREIAGLVHRAMAARPELRFATATEMRLALERAKTPGAAAGPAPSPAQAGSMASTHNEPPMGARGPDTQAPEPPVHTLRAPPIASALAHPVYGGAAVPAAPSTGGGGRRRGGMPVAVLVAIPVVLGAAIVALLMATGTFSSTPSPPSPILGRLDDPEPDAGAALTVATATTAPPVSDVPKLVPTRPGPPAPVGPGPAPARPAPSPSAHASAQPVDDAAAPPATTPFGLPSTFPTAIPPLPSVLPLPPGFPPLPSAFPSAFPTAIPGWPSPTPANSAPPASTASAPGN